MERLILKGAARCGTTITRDILSAHPDIYLTNEVRLYWVPYSFKTAEDYFKKLKQNVERMDANPPDWRPDNYCSIPDYVDMNNFVEDCMSHLQKDTVKDRILGAEKVLYGDRYRYFGDKGATPDTLRRMSKDLPYKLIFIVRDGRHVASSKIRLGWSSDIVRAVNDWTKTIGSTLDVIDKDYIIIRFEDYIDYPERNTNKMAKFLGVGKEKLFNIKQKLFSIEKAHKGYYKDYCPDWNKTFPKKTKQLLERLNYI